MASKVKMPKNKDFSFETSGRGFAAKYPWDDWFSGDLLMLERHEGPENDKGTIEDDAATVKKDYGVPNDGMLPKIKTAARARYKVCQVSRKDADGQKLVNALIIKARPMTPDERVEEDELRAVEKADKAHYDAVERDAINTAKAQGLSTEEAEAAGKAARKAAVKAGGAGATATNGQVPATAQATTPTA